MRGSIRRIGWLVAALTIGLGMSVLLLLTWTSSGVAQPAVVSASAPLPGRPFTFTKSTQPSPIDEYEPAVAYNTADKEFLIVWTNRRPFANDDIYAQRVSINGELLSWFAVNEFAPAGERGEVAVAYNPHHNDYLIVYTRYDSSSASTELRGRRVSYAGPQGSEFLIAYTSTNAGDPTIAFNSQQDEYLVAWRQSGPSHMEIWGRRVVGEAGTGIGGSEFNNSAQNLSAPWARDCYSPDLAYHATRNEYALAFTYESVTDANVYVRLITASGGYSAGQQVWINTKAEQASVAANADADQYLIVYQNLDGTGGSSDIWAYTLPGSFFGGVHGAIVQGTTTMKEPDVARLGDTDLYQIVWTEWPSTEDVKTMRMDVSRNQGPQFDISASATASEFLPVVADGSPMTLVVWVDGGWGTGSNDVAARLLGYRALLPLILRD